jgi:hypothetical protein
MIQQIQPPGEMPSRGRNIKLSIAETLDSARLEGRKLEDTTDVIARGRVIARGTPNNLKRADTLI